MNYELAKKLKDNGFPNSEKWVIKNDIITLDSPFSLSLSELIEACGDRFSSINKINGEWVAVNCKTIEDEESIEFDFKNHSFGKTPEEAVANLWLELNKN